MTVAFLFASLLLAVTPGPGVVYIVSRTLAQGRAAGVASALGVAVGNAANAVGAAMGLAALFAASALAFTVVKLAGAAYLIWLGVRLLRADATRSNGAKPAIRLPAVPATRLFRDGALVAMLNPKTALFFAAFLPQFMHAGEAALPQAVLLGAVFVGVAALTDLGYVMLAGAIGAMLAPVGMASRWGRRLSGSVLIGLGIVAATTTASACEIPSSPAPC